MTSHYDCSFFCDLKMDAPQHVIDVLKYLTRSQDYPFYAVPDHEFFRLPGWRNWLQIRPSYSCGPGSVGRAFFRTMRRDREGQPIEYYTLSFRRCVSSEGDMHQLWWYFLYWLAPYAEGGFVGFFREEHSLHPTLIYLKRGKIFRVEPNQDPVGWYGERWN